MVNATLFELRDPSNSTWACASKWSSQTSGKPVLLMPARLEPHCTGTFCSRQQLAFVPANPPNNPCNRGSAASSARRMDNEKRRSIPSRTKDSAAGYLSLPGNFAQPVFVASDPERNRLLPCNSETV